MLNQLASKIRKANLQKGFDLLGVIKPETIIEQYPDTKGGKYES